MIRHIVFLSAISAPLLLAGTLPSTAAKSPAMESCSAEWAKMKEAKTIPEGQTWPKFWSQCSKDYKAAHATDTTTDQSTTNTDETTAPTTKKAKKATKTAVNEDEPTGSSAADKKACDGKWHDYKTSSGEHGWKAYFTFMAKCMP
jgi:hypothetical protein